MGDVAVITGGASGFGLALADRCAERGMQVALLDLDGDRVDAEASALAAARGVETLGLAVDVGDAASVTAAAAAVDDRFGRADLVVSNVGVQLFGALDRLTDDEWQWVLDVNVIGSARVARSFVPLLRPTRGRLAFTTATPEDAARQVIDAVLAGEPYVITHGDLVEAIDSRAAALRRAAEAAR